MSLGVRGLPRPRPMDNSLPSISSLRVATESARSTGLRKYWTVTAVPSLMFKLQAMAARVTYDWRLRRLSVTHNWETPLVSPSLANSTRWGRGTWA